MKLKKEIIFYVILIIIGIATAQAATLVTDRTTTVDNLTIVGPVINITADNASMKFFIAGHSLFANEFGEPIEIWNTVPQAKGGIGWYSYDAATDRVRATGWFVCHYNSTTNGSPHSHCSIETLDNTTGSPTLNSHLEVDYGANLSRANIKFPTADVQFISLQKLYFGDTLASVFLMHNSTTGNFEIKSNADLYLIVSQVQFNSADLQGVDDIFTSTGSTLDFFSDSTTRIFPNGQSSIDFAFTNGTGKGIIQVQGANDIEFQDNLTVTNLAGTGNDFACLDSTGKLFRSDTQCA